VAAIGYALLMCCPGICGEEAGTMVRNTAHIRRRYTVGTVYNVRPLLYVTVVKLHWEGVCMGVKLGASL